MKNVFHATLYLNTFAINVLIIQYIQCSMLTVLTVHDHRWTNWLTIHSKQLLIPHTVPLNITFT